LRRGMCWNKKSSQTGDELRMKKTCTPRGGGVEKNRIDGRVCAFACGPGEKKNSMGKATLFDSGNALEGDAIQKRGFKRKVHCGHEKRRKPIGVHPPPGGGGGSAGETAPQACSGNTSGLRTSTAKQDSGGSRVPPRGSLRKKKNKDGEALRRSKTGKTRLVGSTVLV